MFAKISEKIIKKLQENNSIQSEQYESNRQPNPAPPKNKMSRDQPRLILFFGGAGFGWRLRYNIQLFGKFSRKLHQKSAHSTYENKFLLMILGLQVNVKQLLKFQTVKLWIHTAQIK